MKPINRKGIVHARHDKYGTRAYGVWRNMKSRCSNPKHPAFRHYGARGITVCARWQSFSAFLEDMGEPAKGMTLERVDNNKGYSPDNCKWATMTEQARNRRNNKPVTFNGKTQFLSDWAKETGIAEAILYMRLYCGWSVEDALTLPAGTYRHCEHLKAERAPVAFHGDADGCITSKQLAEAWGVSRQRVQQVLTQHNVQVIRNGYFVRIPISEIERLTKQVSP